MHAKNISAIPRVGVKKRNGPPLTTKATASSAVNDAPKRLRRVGDDSSTSSHAHKVGQEGPSPSNIGSQVNKRGVKRKRRKRRKSAPVDFGEAVVRSTALEDVDKDLWAQYVSKYRLCTDTIAPDSLNSGGRDGGNAEADSFARLALTIKELQERIQLKYNKELMPLVKDAEKKGKALDEALEKVKLMEEEMRLMEQDLSDQMEQRNAIALTIASRVHSIGRVGEENGVGHDDQGACLVAQQSSSITNVSWEQPFVVPKRVEQSVLKKLVVKGEFKRLDDDHPRLQLLLQPKSPPVTGPSRYLMTVQQMARLHNFAVQGGSLYNIRRQVAKSILRRFHDDEEDILTISRAEDVPPVKCVVAILGLHRWQRSAIEDAIRDASLISDKRIRLAMKTALKNDTVAIDQSDRVAADRFENLLEAYLSGIGARFQKEAELKREQKELFGVSILTPDFLLLEPLRINGSLVHWIDAKNIYLCDNDNLGKNMSKKTTRYTENFGPGAIVCSLGYCDAMQARMPKGVLLLDGYVVWKGSGESSLADGNGIVGLASSSSSEEEHAVMSDGNRSRGRRTLTQAHHGHAIFRSKSHAFKTKKDGKTLSDSDIHAAKKQVSSLFSGAGFSTTAGQRGDEEDDSSSMMMEDGEEFALAQQQLSSLFSGAGFSTSNKSKKRTKKTTPRKGSNKKNKSKSTTEDQQRVKKAKKSKKKKRSQ